MSVTSDTPSHSTGSNAYIKRAYEPQTVDSTRNLYDEWAAKYDADLVEEGYQAPSLAAPAITSFLGAEALRTATVLDAGCGTGLVGQLLARDYGASTVDGVDLSPGMLEVARKTGVYRHLEAADLSEPMAQRDASYDVVVCVGTLTRAHLGPRVLNEFARIVRGAGSLSLPS